MGEEEGEVSGGREGVGRDRSRQGWKGWGGGIEDLGPQALDGLGGKPQLHMAVALQ